MPARVRVDAPLAITAAKARTPAKVKADATLLLSRSLPWGLVLVGVFISITLELCGIRSLSFAVGSYLPIATTAPIFAGGMVRAYVTFAGRMLALAADLLEASAPEEAALCGRAADARTELHAALAEARVDYIGDDPHSSESRLNRFLKRLAQDN